MSEWIERELAENQRHDLRHTKRLAPLFEQFRAQTVRGPAALSCRVPSTAGTRALPGPPRGVLST